MTKLDLEQRKALHSGDYAAEFQKVHPPVRIGRLLNRLVLPADAVIADFGCGSALLLDHIKDKVAAYVGVDFSPDFIAIAEARAQTLQVDNAEFYCGSIEAFGVGNLNRFDAVFVLDLSEHVYDDEWQGIVRSAWTVLKPGGCVYLHTPNRLFFIERMKDKNFILKQFPHHVAVRTPEGNAAFFVDAGFVDVQVDLIAHYNVLRYLHWLSALPGIGSWLKARIFLTARKPDTTNGTLETRE